MNIFGVPIVGGQVDDMARMLWPGNWGNLVSRQGIIPAMFAERGKRGATAWAGIKEAGPHLNDAGKLAGGSLLGGYLTFGLPIALFSAAQAPHRHKLSAFAAGATPFLGMAIGTALGGGLGGLVGGFVLDPMLQASVGKAMQYAADAGRNMTRLQTGGDYVDSEPAWTMRQAAAQEMSRSLLNARQYLGKEGAFLHG